MKNKQWWLLILLLTIIMVGWYVIFISELGLNNELSVFFGFISACSLLGAFIIYFIQKGDNDIAQKSKLKACKKALKVEKKKIKKLIKNTIEICNKIDNSPYDSLHVRLRANAYSFIFKYENDESQVKSIILYDSELTKLINISNNLLQLNSKSYRACIKLMKKYEIFSRNISSLFYELNPNSPQKDKIKKPRKLGNRLRKKIGKIKI